MGDSGKAPGFFSINILFLAFPYPPLPPTRGSRENFYKKLSPKEPSLKHMRQVRKVFYLLALTVYKHSFWNIFDSVNELNFI